MVEHPLSTSNCWSWPLAFRPVCLTAANKHTPARARIAPRGVNDVCRCRVRRSVKGRFACSDSAEPVDRGLVLGAHLGVAHAEALGGGEAEHADLALVGVLVDVEGGLADVIEAVGPR